MIIGSVVGAVGRGRACGVRGQWSVITSLPIARYPVQSLHEHCSVQRRVTAVLEEDRADSSGMEVSEASTSCEMCEGVEVWIMCRFGYYRGNGWPLEMSCHTITAPTHLPHIVIESLSDHMLPHPAYIFVWSSVRTTYESTTPQAHSAPDGMALARPRAAVQHCVGTISFPSPQSVYLSIVPTHD